MEQITDSFSRYFSNWNICLPQPVPGKGIIRQSGWTIRFCIHRDANNPVCLDVSAFHRMTNHRHFRIYQNGEITGLPGYRDFIVYNKDPDRDLERKKAEIHNQAVSEILKNYEQE